MNRLRFWTLIIAIVALIPVVYAQTPATAPPVAAAPQLDDLERAWLQLTNLSEQLAYSECQRLESVQKFNATLGDVVKRLEERHPGFTLNRERSALVAKAK